MAKSAPKNGKLPASTRSLLDDLQGFGESSVLDVDSKIKKHLETSGMTIRWINARKFKEQGGFSSKGWAPVRTSDLPKELLAGSMVAFGSTAEGFIVRNDLMLACRSQEMTERHERQLRAKTALASGKNKINADNIRQSLGEYGRVIEGYEDNGEE